ncbi:virulence-associated protein [Geminocystis sp. GBBB08]|uniref:virulence-associated protein n=1 Tax=Geminocystis sp. GBBB08 TaxID=2604140 RepID=UPI0027E22D9E|nr:virulence-associated protein [Geminocystis sp. GBBB08]
MENAECRINNLIAFTSYFLEKEANLSANIRAFLRKNGTSIGAYDILIGAKALSTGLTLITANTKEFERIPNLEFINWRK